MDAVKFYSTFKRMCAETDCKDCLLDQKCRPSANVEPEEVVKLVEQWAKDHPVKTRQSEFLKMFPDSRFDGNGVLCIEPCCIELSRYRFSECSKKDCENCRRDYWLAEVTDND